jgi:hypothetical protein
MEEENTQGQLGVEAGTQQLLGLIGQFLSGPDPDVEHKMTLFSPDHYLNILSSSEHPREVIVTCCSALRLALNRRNEFLPCYQSILGTVEALYLSGSEDLCNLLETVLQKLIEIYLDDDKKLELFESVSERLSLSNDLRQCGINQRVVRFTVLLVRSMAYLTLNN